MFLLVILWGKSMKITLKRKIIANNSYATSYKKDCYVVQNDYHIVHSADTQRIIDTKILQLLYRKIEKKAVNLQQNCNDN